MCTFLSTLVILALIKCQYETICGHCLRTGCNMNSLSSLVLRVKNTNTIWSPRIIWSYVTHCFLRNYCVHGSISALWQHWVMFGGHIYQNFVRLGIPNMEKNVGIQRWNHHTRHHHWHWQGVGQVLTVPWYRFWGLVLLKSWIQMFV